MSSPELDKDYLELKKRTDLVALCKERGIKGYSSKTKIELVKLLLDTDVGVCDKSTRDTIIRLNYIGSKFQLLSWLEDNIRKFTAIDTFENVSIADLFSGTGIVSYHFRGLGSCVIANDTELYSSIVTHAFTRSVFTVKCRQFIENTVGHTVGFITKNYSPYETCERKFFTVSNAMAIDFIRERLEELRDTFTDDEYKFLLASLIVSADAISNVPAVYGCYLKNFKAKALKPFTLKPIHTVTVLGNPSSVIYHSDVLKLGIEADIVYLDPPYNERQYSKNYFPLGVLALSPNEQLLLPPLKGKTGIPADCFISLFCGRDAEIAFVNLFSRLKARFIFLSYNSEGIVPIDKLEQLARKYGTTELIEREYKRFKSFDHNKKVEKKITEYLLCVKLKK